jgi:hypothetical protein
MHSLRVVGLAAIWILFFCGPAFADQLAEMIKQSFVPATFKDSALADEARVFVTAADHRSMLIGKAQIVEFMDKAKAAGVENEVSKYQEINRASVGGYTTILYLIEIHQKFKGEEKSLEYTCSDIWQDGTPAPKLLFGTSEERVLRQPISQ